MTDQQAPERIWFYNDDVAGWIGLSKPHLDQYGMEPIPYVRKDLHDAAIKQRDELAAELREADDRANKFATKEMHTEKRALKAEAERDQALASVGAVIEKAVEAIKADCENEYENGECPSIEAAERATTELAIMAVRASNPDATAALNEMLADAWGDGYDQAIKDDFGSKGYTKNPYRKDVKK